ncbi:MAG: hypothetical protein ACOC1O_02590 [bacterium]
MIKEDYVVIEEILGFGIEGYEAGDIISKEDISEPDHLCTIENDYCLTAEVDMCECRGLCSNICLCMVVENGKVKPISKKEKYFHIEYGD